MNTFTGHHTFDTLAIAALAIIGAALLYWCYTKLRKTNNDQPMLALELYTEATRKIVTLTPLLNDEPYIAHVTISCLESLTISGYFSPILSVTYNQQKYDRMKKDEHYNYPTTINLNLVQGCRIRNLLKAQYVARFFVRRGQYLYSPYLQQQQTEAELQNEIPSAVSSISQ